MDAQQIIANLTDRMRRETTEEQKAYLAGGTTPTGTQPRFFDWHGAIDNLNLTSGECPWFTSEKAAALRTVLHRVADMTCQVGGKLVRVGKRLLAFIFDQFARYPQTLACAVVLAALCFFASSVPLVGVMLCGIVHSVGTVLLGLVFIGENALNLCTEFRRGR